MYEIIIKFLRPLQGPTKDYDEQKNVGLWRKGGNKKTTTNGEELDAVGRKLVHGREGHY